MERMAEPYLRALGSLLDRAAPGLDVPITCRHFFGGAAAYAEGRIFMTLTTAGLALKLPQDARARLTAEGGAPLRYFPKAPVKKDYIVMPRRLAEDPKALAPWIEQSIGFVRSLPKPRKKTPGR